MFLARSPVFKAMFSTQMTDSVENVVKIEDFDEEAVKGMLESIYTGKPKAAEESSLDLLKITDQHQIISSLPVKYQS